MSEKRRSDTTHSSRKGKKGRSSSAAGSSRKYTKKKNTNYKSSSRAGSRSGNRRKRRIRPTAILLWLLALLILVGVVFAGSKLFGHIGSWISQRKATNPDSPSVVTAELQTTPAATEAETEVETEAETEPETEDTTKRRAFSMIFGGDVWLDEVADTYKADGIDGILSEELLSELKSADLAMVNEEFPFGSGGTVSSVQQNPLRVNASLVSAFKDMGVDLVSLANDHTLDYGATVLSQTFSALDKAEIDYAGAGDSAERAKQWMTYQFGSTKVAVLCATRVLPSSDWNVDEKQPGLFACYDYADLTAQITAAKEENDLVVVYVHWGIEKSSTVEDYQTELAHACVDAGADLVVGSHPHVLQGIEYYNKVPIVYSLGNLIYHSETDQTMLLKVNVSKRNKLTLQLIPAAAADNKTSEVTGDEGQAILDYVKSLSTKVKISEDGTVSRK